MAGPLILGAGSVERLCRMVELCLDPIGVTRRVRHIIRQSSPRKANSYVWLNRK